LAQVVKGMFQSDMPGSLSLGPTAAWMTLTTWRPVPSGG
jgi:hypothetical protein